MGHWTLTGPFHKDIPSAFPAYLAELCNPFLWGKATAISHSAIPKAQALSSSWPMWLSGIAQGLHVPVPCPGHSHMLEKHGRVTLDSGAMFLFSSVVTPEWAWHGSVKAGENPVFSSQQTQGMLSWKCQGHPWGESTESSSCQLVDIPPP